MSIPDPVTDHPGQAVALLTSAFRDQRVTPALLRTFANRVQDLEAAIWTVINGRNLTNGAGGVVLDTLGGLVGEARNGRSDADYVAAISLRIKINRSTGRTPEVLAIVALAANGAPWEYHETPPAGFVVLFAGTSSGAKALGAVIDSCKPVGVEAGVWYTSIGLASLFRPSSVYGGTIADRALGSSYGGGFVTVFPSIM